jgi:transposase-like protein
VEVSSDLISSVTDSVLEDVIEWQNRPLDPMYAVVFFDPLRVRIRDEGTVKNKAEYLALGIQRDGTKEVLCRSHRVRVRLDLPYARVCRDAHREGESGPPDLGG